LENANNDLRVLGGTNDTGESKIYALGRVNQLSVLRKTLGWAGIHRRYAKKDTKTLFPLSTKSSLATGLVFLGHLPLDAEDF
jgi:hypothetical protein